MLSTRLEDYGDVLTVAEVAAVLRCSDGTVYKMAAAGELRAYKVGKRGVRFTRSAVRDHLDGRSAA